MLRFAPSPTGDMHIGNLRVAIFNYMLSKLRNESLLIRIEDTDKERNIEGKDKEFLDILGLFGIEHETVINQSSHIKYHRAMALQLIHEKKAFNCFCTTQTLDADQKASEAAKKTYSYSGVCETLHPEETIDNLSPFTVRIRKPNKAIIVKDLIQGEMSFDTNEVDSFVILHQDKNPTYNFACAIDDMISDISLVVRGEDQMSNTPKQIFIRKTLGYDKEIEYAHVPIILNREGKKMSKHDDGSSVKHLLEMGFLPEAIINYLILMGNETPSEIFSMKEALAWFSLDTISKSSAHFDMDKLKFINHTHLKNLDAVELSRYVGFADQDIGELARVYMQECNTLVDLRSKIEPIFKAKNIPEEFMDSAKTLKEVISKAPYIEDYNEFEKYVMSESKLEGKNFFTSLRLLLTGVEKGPDMTAIYPPLKNFIGKIVTEELIALSSEQK
jgi:glutamyl-tRNA synthetase